MIENNDDSGSNILISSLIEAKKNILGMGQSLNLPLLSYAQSLTDGVKFSQMSCVQILKINSLLALVIYAKETEACFKLFFWVNTST